MNNWVLLAFVDILLSLRVSAKQSPSYQNSISELIIETIQCTAGHELNLTKMYPIMYRWPRLGFQFYTFNFPARNAFSIADAGGLIPIYILLATHSQFFSSAVQQFFYP